MGVNESSRYLDKHVDYLVDALELVREPTGIRQALQQFAKATGYDRFAYGHIQARTHASCRTTLKSGLSDTLQGDTSR